MYENSERWPELAFCMRVVSVRPRVCVVLCLCIATPVSGCCLRTQGVAGIQELQLCFQAQLFQAQGDECRARPRESVHRNLWEWKISLLLRRVLLSLQDIPVC